jgi:type VI protein secretion system component VasK
MFYKKHLEGSLERDGDSFVPVAKFQHSILYTGDFLQCYTRGAVITENTFGPGSAPVGSDTTPGVGAVPVAPEAGGGEGPIVEFDINLHSVSESVSEVTFDIDGTARTYKNTPQEWLHVQWPAKDAKVHGATVKVRGYGGLDEEITRPGDFGLFRMLDAATSIVPGTEGGKTGGSPTIVATWTLKSQNAWVKMDIRPPQTESAFSSYIVKHERVFRNYKCPRVASSGVR